MRNIFNLYETCCSDALLIKTKKTYEAGVTDLKRRDVGGGTKRGIEERWDVLVLHTTAPLHTCS